MADERCLRSVPLVALRIVENSRIDLSLLFRIIEKGKIQVVHLYCINADLLYISSEIMGHWFTVITGLRL